MSESAAEELVRRAKVLGGRAEAKHQGSGHVQREYEVGDISFVIDGHYDGNTMIEYSLFIDVGDVEILEMDYPNGLYDGEGFIDVKADISLIERVLEVARREMVLDDLADV